MFVVYKLFFESSDKIYIGKTYDINKRLTDHNYTVFILNEQTHKGNWIRKHSEIFDLQYEILFETEDEQEAYIKELEIIKDCVDKGVPIVNTQRLIEAGGRKGARVPSTQRKETMQKRFGKDYVLISKAGEVIHTSCLSVFASERGLIYKNLNACARGICFISQGYKVLYKQVWDLLSPEDKDAMKQTVEGYNPRKTKAIETHNKNMGKEFWLLNKDGFIEHGVGVKAYCREMGYDPKAILNSLSYRKTTGWERKLFYSLDELNKYKTKNFIGVN